jgi:hypothetical protein
MRDSCEHVNESPASVKNKEFRGVFIKRFLEKFNLVQFCPM